MSPAGSYAGIAHCAAQVLRHEGWRSFYRGMLPSMVRARALVKTKTCILVTLALSWQRLQSGGVLI